MGCEHGPRLGDIRVVFESVLQTITRLGAQYVELEARVELGVRSLVEGRLIEKGSQCLQDLVSIGG